jgi:hypothetical protein
MTSYIASKKKKKLITTYDSIFSPLGGFTIPHLEELLIEIIQ